MIKSIQIQEDIFMARRRKLSPERKKFIPHKIGMQVSHSLCTKIQKAGNLQTDQGRCCLRLGTLCRKKQ